MVAIGQGVKDLWRFPWTSNTTCRRLHDMQNAFFPERPDHHHVRAYIDVESVESIHGSESPCLMRTCNNGGVCKRHCRALLRKHVFPMLLRPDPTLAEFGHVVTIVPVNNDFPEAEDCVEISEDLEGLDCVAFFDSLTFVEHG